MKEKKLIPVVSLVLVLTPFIVSIFSVFNLNDSNISVFTNRQFNIFTKTFIYGITCSIFTTTFAGLISILTIRHLKKLKLIIILLLSYMAIPPYIHSFSWMKGLKLFLNINGITGFIISVIVQSIYLLPLATVIWIIFYLNIPKSYFDEASLNIDKKKLLKLLFFQKEKALFC